MLMSYPLGLYGKPVTDSQQLISLCPADRITISSATRALLPGEYRLQEYRDLPGLGMAFTLQVGILLTILF